MTTDKPTEFDVEAYIAGAPDRSPRFTESDLRIVAERVASSMTDALAEKDAEIARLRGGMVDTQLAWGRSASVKTAVRDLPQGVFQGANRYDTDNECVLSLWVDGKTYDVRWPKGGAR